MLVDCVLRARALEKDVDKYQVMADEDQAARGKGGLWNSSTDNEHQTIGGFPRH